MKSKIALFALALLIAADVPLYADNPSDAPLVVENRTPETASTKPGPSSEPKTNKKDHALKAQQAPKQPATSQAAARQPGAGMH